ncbi:MAG: exodeoxyribonuclease VII small subunit [Candidatus Dojkabacteria bacterium]
MGKSSAKLDGSKGSSASSSEASKKLSEQLKELEKISSYFDSEEVDVDTAIEKYEAGMKLASEIKQQLVSYEQKIERIKERYEQGN